MLYRCNQIKLWSAVTSLFDVRRWTFDVRRSSFKKTLHGVNVICECLQNKLALMGPAPPALWNAEPIPLG